MNDLIVIGGGPGGIAAAAYALHLGLETILIAPDLGGRVNHGFSIQGIDNVETVHGAELTHTLAAKIGPDSHVPEGVRSIDAVDDGFRVTLLHGDFYLTRALVVATGAKPRRLH